MFGRTPKIPLDIELGMTLVEQENMSYQNYAKKLQDRLRWAYQKAQKNNQKESEHHKKYYDKRIRCMTLKPGDLVLVHTKVPSGDHKIADQWEDVPHPVLSQLAEQPVFQVQPIDAVEDENIRVLHRNMLFPVQSVTDTDSVKTDNEKHIAFMKANLLMDIHFNN